MKLLIVDDHPLFREGLKTIIAKSPSYDVVAEAGSGREGIEMVRRHQPDIALVDISMPNMNGIQFIREAIKQGGGMHFIIISMHSEADYIVEAFHAGASGYMVKESAASQLLECLDMVSKGEIFLDSSLSREVVFRLLNNKDSSHAKRDPYSSLTSREQEVLRLLAEGFNTRDIAQQLYISPKTVENHRANLMKKLKLNSPVELIRYAARIGLIDLDTWAT
ncbi:response regulator [Salidesulfovibrio brasiliensis]|uniref:response regulator n=1 Tax=Salidesulfovibrio brasiliensis TaxID=221711 RepID=UPI0006D25560|nr:response regulator transcription factor [Salidesulfovibrio brasiliensis]